MRHLLGEHENTLALALAEARKAADSLADSLAKDLEKLHELASVNPFHCTAALCKYVLGCVALMDTVWVVLLLRYRKNR
jgi:hypothetical protein